MYLTDLKVKCWVINFPYESRLDTPSESAIKNIENKILKFKECLAKVCLISKDFCKGFQVSFMKSSMTDAAIKRVEERDRTIWIKVLKEYDILSNDK